MWGGNANSDKSKNVNIYNYNGGSITSDQLHLNLGILKIFYYKL